MARYVQVEIDAIGGGMVSCSLEPEQSRNTLFGWYISQLSGWQLSCAVLASIFPVESHRNGCGGPIVPRRAKGNSPLLRLFSFLFANAAVSLFA